MRNGDGFTTVCEMLNSKIQVAFVTSVLWVSARRVNLQATRGTLTRDLLLTRANDSTTKLAP